MPFPPGDLKPPMLPPPMIPQEPPGGGFAHWTAMPHYLIVGEKPPDLDDDTAPDDFAVEHPAGCPGEEDAFGCGVAVEKAMVGLRTFFRHRDEPADGEDDRAAPVGPGRHRICAWYSGGDSASWTRPDPVESTAESGLALGGAVPPTTRPRSRWDGPVHWVIVSEHAPEAECGDDALELLHPDGCPGASDDRGCGVAGVVSDVGLRWLFRHRDEPGVDKHDYAVPLPPGRHRVRSWHAGPDWQGGYDSGVRLVDRPPSDPGA